MQTTNTHERRIPDANAAAIVAMVDGWTDDVLGVLNMTEGQTLAEMMEMLGAPDTAEHVLRTVWECEGDDADPTPWANGHGSRLSEDDYTRRLEDLQHNEGDERFYFAPRNSAELTEEGR